MKRRTPHFPLPADALPLPWPQTPESARSHIKTHGLCVSEISRVTEINRNTFVALLSGKQLGLRGNAHRAAVLLGLKPDSAASKTGVGPGDSTKP